MNTTAITKPIAEERYVFDTDWYDQQAELVRHYRLTYYPSDCTVEMYDKKLNRIFLKRVECAGLSMRDFFVGAKVTVMSRVLTVVGYSDEATAARQRSERESTFAMIKPCSYNNIGKILDQVQKAGFVINKLKMSKHTPETCKQFYAEHVGKEFYPNLENFMSSDVCVGMELIENGAIKAWREFIGPTNSLKAKEEKPKSIRGTYGTDGTKNAVHGSDSTESAAREIGFFFGGANGPMKTTAVLNNCTLCLIKPHIIREGKLGEVIDSILSAGFEISAMEMFNLSRAVIEEFYDVYKGVIPEYLPVIEHISNGPSVLLEVR